MSGIYYLVGRQDTQSGQALDSVWLGSWKGDGAIYFNDNDHYRVYSADLSRVDLWLPQQRIWVQTTRVSVTAATELDLGEMSEGIDQIISGGGPVAPNAMVEQAVVLALEIAEGDHGYDQRERYGTPDYDCSSLVSHCFYAAGFNVYEWCTTATMKASFESAGFTAYDTTVATDVAKLQRGDILLIEGNHTEIYIGGGQNVGAHCNEKGGIGLDPNDETDETYWSEPGDQTGREISVEPYDALCNGVPWQYVLRYEG